MIERTEHEGEKFNVTVINTSEGIIVDVYNKEGVLLNTSTYWNDDANDGERMNDGI